MRRRLPPLLALSMLLSGCTLAGTPESGSATLPPTPESTESAHELTEGPVAVVTIAAIDVDVLHLTLAGFVTMLAESGGQCEFTVTSEINRAVVTRVVTGEINVDSTSCGSVQIPVTELAKGPWDAALSYMTADGPLISELERVEIP